MKIPFQIYDFIGILFPGFLVLLLIRIEYSTWPMWRMENGLILFIIWLVISFFLGHLLQELSRYIFKVSYLPITELFSLPIQKRISSCFYDYYKINIKSIKTEEVFPLIVSPVHDKMSERSLFQAISNYHRSMILVVAIWYLYSLVKFYYIKKSIFLFILIFGVFLIFLCWSRMKFFKKYSDRIPYYAFLAWYSEKNHSDRRPDNT